MSTDFINVKNKDVETGDIYPDKKAAEAKRKKMMELIHGKAEKPKSEEADLGNIDKVVGGTHEEEISMELLTKVPKEWDVFPPATEDTIKKMSTSIYQYGLFHRVTLWKQKNGKYMILGGNTRAACYEYIYSITEEDKYKTIPAKVYDYAQLTEDDAHRIFLVSNTDQRTMSVKTISEAYCNLMSLEKKKAFYGSGIYARDAAAKQANVGTTTFSHYLRISTLYAPLLEAADSSAITVKAAYQLSLLPQKLQKYVYDEGIYIDLSTQAAKAISSCKSEEEIKGTLARLEATPKYYKYTVLSKKQKPNEMEIIPIFVEKSRQAEVLARFSQAVQESNFDAGLKDYLCSLLPKAELTK